MHNSNPINSISLLISNRSLIGQLVRREVTARYRGSMLGVLWSLVTPLLMLAIYSFVFTVVFEARWNVDTGAKGEFSVILFSGLILHAFFAECISSAPTIILRNANFVKKVIFPLEILVPVIAISALFQFFISFLVLIAGALVVYHTLPITIIFLPLVLLPFILLTFGISWILASLGVYIRDIAHVIGIFTTVLLFMSTIFYPASKLPETMRAIIYINPLSFSVDQLRVVTLFGEIPNWQGLCIYTGISIFIFCAGFWWFQKTRRGFADIL